MKDLYECFSDVKSSLRGVIPSTSIVLATLISGFSTGLCRIYTIKQGEIEDTNGYFSGFYCHLKTPALPPWRC